MFRRIMTLAIAGCLLVASLASARSIIPPANWSYHTFGSIQYHLYVPTGLVAGHKYPMALGLHGCCWDNVDTSSSIGDPVSNAWHNYGYNTQIEPTFVVAPLTNDYNQATMISLCRQIIGQYPIDTQRVMLCGFSMGATGSVNILDANPNFFSCAIIVANAGASCNSGMRDMPCWMASGLNDVGYIQNTYNCVNTLRPLNGDAVHSMYETGVNPRYNLYPNTGHGDAMEATFGLPGIMPWAYAHLNDGNHYPMVRFTQSSPAWAEVLPATTTSVTVTAAVTDNDGAITKVEFYCDGALKSTITSSPYTATIAGLTPGDHVILATAYDNGTTQGKTINKTATATLVFGIKSTLAVASPTLPAATAGTFVRDTLKLSGGNGPFSWALANGSALPAGLALTKSGRIEGIPTAAGTYTFTVTVTDTTAATASQALSLTVNSARPGALLVTNIWKRSVQGQFIPWTFRQYEPFGTLGYGMPGGFYNLSTHPIFDGMVSVGALDGCTFLRGPSLSGDILNPGTAGQFTPWVHFDVNVPVRVHIAYTMNTANNNLVPKWMTDSGFVASGLKFRCYLHDLIDYVKQFPAGTITLGPNDGQTTGAGMHYLTIIEPVTKVATLTPSGTVVLFRPEIRWLPSQGLQVTGASLDRSVVRVLDTRGRTVACREIAPAATLVIPTSSISAGAYLVTVRCGSSIGTEMMMVRK